MKWLEYTQQLVFVVLVNQQCLADRSGLLVASLDQVLMVCSPGQCRVYGASRLVWDEPTSWW